MNRTDVDLHVHTVTSGCGYTTHRQVLDLARAAGRGVIAVTDHDSAAGGLAVRELARRSGDDLLVLVGMELTTSDFGHVIVFGRGVEEGWGWEPHRPFPRHIPDHWLAIQAHPYRNKVVQTAAGVEAAALPPLPERIDAVEVWNGGDLIKRVPHLRREMDAISRAYAEREGKTAVASSDSHRPFWLHSFFTRCALPLYSVDDLVAQVRAGEVTPGAAGPAEQAWYLQAWRRRAGGGVGRGRLRLGLSLRRLGLPGAGGSGGGADVPRGAVAVPRGGGRGDDRRRHRSGPPCGGRLPGHRGGGGAQRLPRAVEAHQLTGPGADGRWPAGAHRAPPNRGPTPRGFPG